ncbi:hypothetical protein B0H13DRAFT_1881097 [Mycena leptocephala]|nr:hypothetical protein B0H13DRAFT_1881097 [Mycena leptocephala]
MATRQRRRTARKVSYHVPPAPIQPFSSILPTPGFQALHEQISVEASSITISLLMLGSTAIIVTARWTTTQTFSLTARQYDVRGDTHVRGPDIFMCGRALERIHQLSLITFDPGLESLDGTGRKRSQCVVDDISRFEVCSLPHGR